jgi:hypothetical protein
MTHASVPPENRARLGIADSLVRLSVGVEDVADLRAELDDRVGLSCGVSSTESIPAQSTGDAGSTGRPLVSVVMATYNRSNIIGYSIRSLLASTLQDWELIVVGDACTDDTEAVVAAFSDPRIRFVNLERNCGEQSGPNNAGVALARGRYLAFLNHDDLWLPGHLAALLGAIEADRADLAFSIGMLVVQTTARWILLGRGGHQHGPLSHRDGRCRPRCG